MTWGQAHTHESTRHVSPPQAPGRGLGGAPTACSTGQEHHGQKWGLSNQAWPSAIPSPTQTGKYVEEEKTPDPSHNLGPPSLDPTVTQESRGSRTEMLPTPPSFQIRCYQGEGDQPPPGPGPYPGAQVPTWYIPVLWLHSLLVQAQAGQGFLLSPPTWRRPEEGAKGPSSNGQRQLLLPFFPHRDLASQRRWEQEGKGVQQRGRGSLGATAERERGAARIKVRVLVWEVQAKKRVPETACLEHSQVLQRQSLLELRKQRFQARPDPVL